jgi:tetratricopeptide (TPR) repeat protein
MRGAERPANVRWTHPFLQPLQPLGQNAARQTFIDIADDVHETEEIDKILSLADNIPLAIDLIANLVDTEGIPSVLRRWETQRTSILSEGHNATSNMELSISLSLSGPRIMTMPHALDLLSLLSMLPDGLSNVELLQSDFPLENILACKSTLLRTALAYTDDQQRLKALVPVREYVQKKHPPTISLIHPLARHYQELLELHRKYIGTLSNVGVVGRLDSNFANMQKVMLQCLRSDGPHLAEIISSTCELSRYSLTTSRGHLPLFEHLPDFLPQVAKDHKLEAYFIVEQLNGWRSNPIPNANQLVEQALEHFKHFHDPDMECELILYVSICDSDLKPPLGFFYNVAADYHSSACGAHSAAMQLCQSGLALAVSIGSPKRQSLALEQLAVIKSNSGDFFGAQTDASVSQRVAKNAGNLLIEARAIRVKAVCWQHLGSYSYCISLLDRAIHLVDLCGMSGGDLHSAIRNLLAEIHRCKSEYVEARNIHIYDISGDQNPYDHALSFLNIAQIDVELLAAEDDVQQNLDTAVTLFQRLNFSTGLQFCDMIRAALYLQKGNYLVAMELFQLCFQSAWGKDTEAVAYCLEKMASVKQWRAAHQTSFTYTFLAHSVKCKQKLELHKALQFIGDLFQAHGDQDTALSLFTAALEGFTQMDVHRSRAECITCLGDISKENGDEFKAAELWQTARPLFERSSQSKQIAQLDAKLAGLSHKLSQGVQQETLHRFPEIHLPTGSLEWLSGAENPNPTAVEEVERKAPIRLNT